jgi:hypothetical protein
MFIVYKTTNIINQRYYIGVHNLSSKTSHKFYLGSGSLLKSAIKKYGRETFVRETLFEFNNLQDALAKEKEIVTEEFIKDDNNYNLTEGGSMPPNSKTWWTEEHSLHTSLRLIGNSHKLGKKESLETKAKKSISMKNSTTQGRWKRTEEHCQAIADRSREQFKNSNPMQNQSSRQKVSQSKIGRKKMIDNNRVSKFVKPEEFQMYLDRGFNFVQ